MAKMTGFKVYKGTKEAFIEAGKAAANANAIVFITGGNDASKSCVYAQGTYFANFTEFIAAYIGALNYVKGINVGGQPYNAAVGGGYVAFSAKDPSTIAVNANSNGVEIGLSDNFMARVSNLETNLGSPSATADKDGSAFARIANLAALVSDLTGGSTDSIEGQITAAINGLRTEIVGTLDAGDAATLAAINDELDGLDGRVKAIADDYLKAADKTELANRITNESPVTITEAAGSGDILKTYTFTQNGQEIGTINLAKELVVTGGDIVEINGVKNLQLTIANQSTPVNIPVTDLVDVYTAKANADKVQVAISSANEISASIVAGAVTATELAANAVETGKIADKNVTKAKLADDVQASLEKADSAYQKPADGIAKADLASDVQTSLGKADAAAPQATTYTKEEVDNMWVWEEL